MSRWLVIAIAMVLCTDCASGTQKVPEPFGTRAAIDVLRDGLIRASIKTKLTGQDPDSVTSLGVSVLDRVVTLTGTVRDAAHRTADVAAAREVTGVRSVVNDLRVDPKGPRPSLRLTEAEIATRIVAAYTAEVGFQRVQVHVDRGVVTLEGPVANAGVRRTIVATAHATKGVRSVIDRMTISKS